MSRPVGGWGAGCGGAGLLSILLAVAIVTWLGSRSLGLLGDGSGNDGGRNGAVHATTIDPAVTAERTEATVDPTGALADGQRVTVSAPDLGAGPATATLCIASGPTTVPLPPRCAPGTTPADDAQPDDDQGTTTARVVRLEVRRHLDVDGASTDCAAAPGTCVVVVRLDDGSRAAVAPLTFAA